MNRLVKIVLVLALMLAVLPISGIFAQDGGTPIAQGVDNTGEGAAIYAEPSIYADVVAQSTPGAVWMIYEEDGLWVLVDGGWTLASNLDISAAQVDLEGTANTRTDFAIRETPFVTSDVIATMPGGSTVGVFVIDGLWAGVYDGDHLGWAFAADLDLSEPSAQLTQVVQRQGEVVSDVMAVRVDASPQAEALTTVEAGEVATIYAFSDNGLFAFVNAGGHTGWAFASDMEVSDKVYGLGTINAGPANFRDAPDGVAVNRVGAGDGVYILGQSEDGAWIKVKYQGSMFIDGAEVSNPTGWVSAGLVDTDASDLPVVE